MDVGEGPSVVMVHGNPTWSFLYRDPIRRLSPTHRCVAMDRLGFGLSDKPRSWSYLPEARAENLAALIEGLGLRNFFARAVMRRACVDPRQRTSRP